MDYLKEIDKDLKNIASELRGIRSAMQKPRTAHWIIDAAAGDRAYCSTCGNAVDVEDTDAFCEFLTERPLMCQKCRAIMCEEVTIS